MAPTSILSAPKRYAEIISKIIAFGFGESLEFLKDQRIRWFRSKAQVTLLKKKKAQEQSQWARVRLLLEDLGPTFIKFGQVLSNREDLLPVALIKELQQLQGQVKAFSREEVIEIARTELGERAEPIISVLPDEPVAAASMAQVYRLELPMETENSSNNVNRTVALKVQRPNVRKVVETDMVLLEGLLQVLQHILQSSSFDSLLNLFTEFRKIILRELDLRLEMKNLVKMAGLFEEDDEIVIPRSYPNFSSEKVLMMDWLDGKSLQEILNNGVADQQSENLAEILSGSYFAQLFLHGFYHADPHPGNILVLENNAIGYIDFGMTGVITPRERDLLVRFLLHAVSGNSERAADLLLRICETPISARQNNFVHDLHQIFSDYLDLSLKNIAMDRLFLQFTSVAETYDLRLPASVIFIFKTLVMVEGITRQLAPQFHLLPFLQRYLMSYFIKRYSPKELIQKGILDLLDAGSEFPDLFLDFHQIIERLKEGRTKIYLDEKSIQPFNRALDKISNRFMFAIVIAALVIGSSIMVHAKIPPLWNNIPVIGIIGFAGAGILSLWLLLMMIIQKKL